MFYAPRVICYRCDLSTAGQALILRGPNGLGKTTPLLPVAGLQPVHEGQVDVTDAAVLQAFGRH